MKYILNPGDFKDVETFADKAEAVEALNKALDPFARLYRLKGRRLEELLHTGEWGEVERMNLPVKVLRATIPSKRKP